MAEKTVSVQDASNSTIYTYGIGGIGVGIKNNFLGTWALIYYNQVLGLDAYLVTIALAIALIFDAISDPLVGIWSDRVRTRWGRRHPFMYLAVIPFALSYYFLLPSDFIVTLRGLVGTLFFMSKSLTERASSPPTITILVML
mgnify:CR=1 FL=1